jgi:hypothetical protein
VDTEAFKAAILRFGMALAFFGVLVAGLFAAIAAIDLLPGVSHFMAQIALLLILTAWTIRQMYLEAKDDKDGEDDDSE